MYIKQCLESPFADVVSYIMPVPEDGFLQNSKHTARFWQNISSDNTDVIDSPPVCAFTGTSLLNYQSQSLYHSMLKTLTQYKKNRSKI